MEAGSFAFPIDIARDICPARPLAVLSGPTFAHEVAAGLPTAITLAAADAATAEALAQALARPHFRPYVSTDMIGAEIGGAVKNILAIACGIVDGAGLGLNARAALISRGFAEMTRFGLARGAEAETLAGLAGLGDLVLTCTSSNSRNFTLGQGLGRGAEAAALMADRRTVAEGAFSAPVIAAAARADGIEMPITDAVARLVAGEIRAGEAIQALLSRPLRPEGR
jgi:glycerol-3-phosphate dehydrogenase (NAD(P)+)